MLINMVAFDVYPLLKISNSRVLNQFLHECVDDLLEKQNANFDNYCNGGDIEWTKEDCHKARRCIQNFYRQSVIENTFQLSNDLASDLQKAIKQCYEIRKNEIFQALAEECVIKNGHNLVDNIDWKLKWVLGTSDIATTREPLLQVDLHCSRKGKSKREKYIVNFEANLEQVDNLISELTKLQKEFL
ncbi:hypothetical protein NQ314_002863 [Rhamnusium bicolor]|uniref:COMM domain-containing protein n=1 Tax=Rhamnusium bicolor TaxID=1586634 RepID=A0AAV8ZNV0_9CUCU|nr:hypothetical protein NQ314_002863 [Rhamnusium bicolor]